MNNSSNNNHQYHTSSAREDENDYYEQHQHAPAPAIPTTSASFHGWRRRRRRGSIEQQKFATTTTAAIMNQGDDDDDGSKLVSHSNGIKIASPSSSRSNTYNTIDVEQPSDGAAQLQRQQQQQSPRNYRILRPAIAQTRSSERTHSSPQQYHQQQSSPSSRRQYCSNSNSELLQQRRRSRRSPSPPPRSPRSRGVYTSRSPQQQNVNQQKHVNQQQPMNRQNQLNQQQHVNHQQHVKNHQQHVKNQQQHVNNQQQVNQQRKQQNQKQQQQQQQQQVLPILPPPLLVLSNTNSSEKQQHRQHSLLLLSTKTSSLRRKINGYYGGTNNRRNSSMDTGNNTRSSSSGGEKLQVATTTTTISKTKTTTNHHHATSQSFEEMIESKRNERRRTAAMMVMATTNKQKLSLSSPKSRNRRSVEESKKRSFRSSNNNSHRTNDDNDCSSIELSPPTLQQIMSFQNQASNGSTSLRSNTADHCFLQRDDVVTKQSMSNLFTTTKTGTCNTANATAIVNEQPQQQNQLQTPRKKYTTLGSSTSSGCASKSNSSSSNKSKYQAPWSPHHDLLQNVNTTNTMKDQSATTSAVAFTSTTTTNTTPPTTTMKPPIQQKRQQQQQQRVFPCRMSVLPETATMTPAESTMQRAAAYATKQTTSIAQQVIDEYSTVTNNNYTNSSNSNCNTNSNNNNTYSIPNSNSSFVEITNTSTDDDDDEEKELCCIPESPMSSATPGLVIMQKTKEKQVTNGNGDSNNNIETPPPPLLQQPPSYDDAMATLKEQERELRRVATSVVVSSSTNKTTGRKQRTPQRNTSRHRRRQFPPPPPLTTTGISFDDDDDSKRREQKHRILALQQQQKSNCSLPIRAPSPSLTRSNKKSHQQSPRSTSSDMRRQQQQQQTYPIAIEMNNVKNNSGSNNSATMTTTQQRKSPSPQLPPLPLSSSSPSHTRRRPVLNDHESTMLDKELDRKARAAALTASTAVPRTCSTKRISTKSGFHEPTSCRNRSATNTNRNNGDDTTSNNQIQLDDHFDGGGASGGASKAQHNTVDDLEEAKRREKMERSSVVTQHASKSNRRSLLVNRRSRHSRKLGTANHSGVPQETTEEEEDGLIRTLTSVPPPPTVKEHPGDIACALAMARSNMKREAEKLCRQDTGGPSLATRTPDEVHPGAFSLVERELTAKEFEQQQNHRYMIADVDDADTDVSEAYSSHASQDNDVVQYDDIEAEAGVLVAFPGAFAVQGLDNSDSDYTSDEDATAVSYTSDIDLGSATSASDDDGDENSAAPSQTALDAEVLEDRVVVDGAIVTAADDEDEEIDPKSERQLRFIQIGVALFTAAVIAIVVGLSLRVTSTGTANSNNSPDGGSLVIEGWQQTGVDIFGPTDEPESLFGSSIALANSGTIMIASAPGIDDFSDLNVGRVYIFQQTVNILGLEWTTIQELESIGPSANPRIVVSSSLDAGVIATGYPSLDEDGGVVQIYTINEGSRDMSWSPIQFVRNNEAGSWYGYDMQISGDGTVLVVGAPLATDATSEFASGAIYIYNKDPSTSEWHIEDGGIFAKRESEFFGWSVTISDDGKTVAAGAPASNGNAGLVRMYSLTGSEWVQIGQDLTGTEPLNRFGESVAISGNGSVLAVGAQGTTFVSGQVHIFRKVIGTDDQWEEDSTSPILGNENGESFGASVSLSQDGTVLAVGRPKNSQYGTDAGLIQVYENSGTKWESRGANIGSTDALSMGTSIAISSDGTRVVGGAPWSSYVGTVSRAGSILAFDRTEK